MTVQTQMRISAQKTSNSGMIKEIFHINHINFIQLLTEMYTYHQEMTTKGFFTLSKST